METGQALDEQMIAKVKERRNALEREIGIVE